MKEILGDVLGKSFSNISLKNYKMTMKEIEDEEDYKRAREALKEDKIHKQKEKEELIKVNETIDVDVLVQSLPLIYKFGLGMIEGFYDIKNLNLLEESQSAKGGSQSENSLDFEDEKFDNDEDFEMKKPMPLNREGALDIIKEEQNRFLKSHYYKI